jgi:hypothetical protein
MGCVVLKFKKIVRKENKWRPEANSLFILNIL